MNELKTKLSKAQLKVLRSVPFFAPGVARLPVVWDETIKTACTDGKEIRWNPKFFQEYEKKDPDLQVTVLCEEVCHCMLGHLWRAPAGADWDTWNAACDQEVRWMMEDFAAMQTSKARANPFPTEPEFAPSPEYRGLSAEEVYHRMINKPGGGKGSGQGNGQGQSQPQLGQFSQPSQGQGQSQPQAQQGQPSHGSKVQWEHALMQAVATTKDKGSLPGSLKRFVKTLTSPTVPWWEILKNFLREQCADDWNFMKPSPFYEDSGFMMPSLESEKMGGVVFATDTSGSINQKVLDKFNTEKQACLDDLSPDKLIDICCDTEITQIKEYRPGDTIDGEAPGGGGSDTRPVFSHIEEAEHQPKCLVYLTDLYVDFPKEEPNYPVLWVTWSPDKKAPFGLTILAE